MIISHRHRFIFIKNRKVASTSMEKALQAICGPEDVLTPDHLHQGESDALAALARNFEGRFNPVREMAGARSPLAMARIARDFASRPKFYNHMRASSVRARIPGEQWDSYYKFCFERNPWDKTISFYYWRHRDGGAPLPLNDYITSSAGGTLDQRLPSDWTRYTQRDRIIVDDVFDYGDIAGGLATALERAGVPAAVREQVELPNLKDKIRQQPEPLDDAASAVIEQFFAREIETFGYTRPGL